MQKMYPEVLLLALLTLLALLFTHSQIAGRVQETDRIQETQGGCMRPHFVLYGKQYGSDGGCLIGPIRAHPFDPETFLPIGTIESTTEDSASKERQSFEIPVGSKLYENPVFPDVIYVDTGDGELVCYCTLELQRPYVFHDGQLYRSVGYEEELTSTYWSTRTETLPDDAVYLGKTNFVGFSTHPQEELDCSIFPEPLEVYKNQQHDVLYLDDPRSMEGYEGFYFLYVPYGAP